MPRPARRPRISTAPIAAAHNLYANSVVALDASTGALKWFRQLVHHDLWDWDLPAPPTLIDVSRNGRRTPAVAQMTKMSLVFVFDRVTGEPIFGVEERPVPPSVVPGEAASPTQPFPLRPAPLARTSFDPARDMYSLTPEHAAYCRDLWAKNNMVAAPMFSPPGLTETMVMFPSTLGGGNWSGFSYDPVRRRLFTNIMNLAQVARMERREPPVEGRLPYRRTSPWGSAYGRFWNPQTKVPCSAPPFGELVAVDVDTRGGRVAGAARGLRRLEGARLPVDRHAEHRRHDQHGQRRHLHRRHRSTHASGPSTPTAASCCGRRSCPPAATPHP